MAERIVVSWESRTFLIRPIDPQFDRDGLLKTEDASSEVVLFFTQPEHRKEVHEAVRGLQGFLENTKLAITPKKLSGWTGTIEAHLQPPVEVVGPKVLLDAQSFD